MIVLGFNVKNCNIRRFCTVKSLVVIILSVIWILLLLQTDYNQNEIIQQDLQNIFLNKSSKLDVELLPIPSALIPASAIRTTTTRTPTFGSGIIKSSHVHHHQKLQSLQDLSASVILRRHPRYGIKECENFTINLYRPDTFNLTGLVSYPGSGNTWIRHLIEFATGVFTGSIYCDVDLYGEGFLGEKEPWNSGSTIVQKLHLGYSNSSRYNFPKAILLIREPYQSIISFVQFLEAGHTGHASQTTFYNKKWPTYVLGQTYSWITMAKSWLESPAKLLVVHYEHLVENSKKELERICTFLNFDCSHMNEPCFDRNMDGRFHRKGKTKPKIPLSKIVREKVDNGIMFLNKLLILHGHDPIPVHLYKFYKLSNETDAIFQ